MFTRPTLGRTYETDLLRFGFLFIVKLVVFLVQKTFQYAAFLFGFQGTKIRDLLGIAKEREGISIYVYADITNGFE